MKKRKHRNMYRVLLIPDDKDEPTAFDLSMRSIRFLKILAVILLVHFIGGIVFYVQYYRIREKNKKLTTVNKKLEENMTMINKLTAEFEVLEKDQNRIRNVLGLSSLNGERVSPEIYLPDEDRTVNFLPVYSRDEQRMPREESELDRYNFILKKSKSSLHDYAKSVPTLLPVDGVLSSDYEYDTANGPSQHRGIDIAGNKGDIVKASADGVVIFAGWTYDLGNLMIIYHGNGFYTYYGHNQRCLLERGSLVKKGEPIAMLGNTGISSAPHLHFEIWKDGVCYDPKDFILAFSNI
ncbi:M23 family metallopeptidase [candidate division KSB1 bacterium]|nr:M23 family metallopeptidase [candidate division KSB1 bacterium]